MVVLGDLNDFEYSAPVSLLRAAGLTDLVETLARSRRYSYVYEGNSQVLDHVMVSDSLFSTLVGFDIVHLNAEFADQTSDHDPAVARFSVGALPTRRLLPILECVVRQGALSWVARFGYDNPNTLAAIRPYGNDNRFVLEAIEPGTADDVRARSPARCVPGALPSLAAGGVAAGRPAGGRDDPVAPLPLILPAPQHRSPAREGP